MKKSKIRPYKRWPKNDDTLKIKLRKISKEIDKILEPETPMSVLMTEEGRDLYTKKFNEHFSKINYRFDSNPELRFEWINKLCGGGVSIDLIYKNREGYKFRLHI